MIFLLVDDEAYAREDTFRVLKQIDPECTVFQAGNYIEALKVCEEETIDVVFCDVEMPGMNGIELVKEIKKIQPEANIIMLTAYREYALEAHQLFVSGYLLKPLDRANLINALENLRRPVETVHKAKLKMKCFGNFDVFYEEKPIHFKRTKEKELLAYLVCLRGSAANLNEICGILWGDEGSNPKKKAYLHKLVSGIKKNLKDYSCDDVLIQAKNAYSLDVTKFSCDYYDYLDHPGEETGAVGFMNQYSWAEEFRPFLY